MGSKNQVYLNHFVVTLVKEVDIDKLYCAVNKVIERNDILRTVFHPYRSESYDFVQIVLSQFSITKHVVELEHDLSQTDLTHLHSSSPYIKALDPMLAPALHSITYISPNSTKLVFSIHHANFDGWSMILLMSEIEKVYFNNTLHHPVKYKAMVDIVLSAPS
ncbi:hypothetical protein HDV03_002820, partial [Kappamyces sp. JEL0829]